MSMHTDDNLGFVTWLEVFSDPLMRSLAWLAAVIFLLEIAVIFAVLVAVPI